MSKSCWGDRASAERRKEGHCGVFGHALRFSSRQSNINRRSYPTSLMTEGMEATSESKAEVNHKAAAAVDTDKHTMTMAQ
eukprot:scaffold13354_cov181-Alexandrium_tamarense.AAC.19